MGRERAEDDALAEMTKAGAELAAKHSISGLMDQIAKEWGQPRSGLNKYVKHLQNQMVSTVPDLIALVNDEETWKEVTNDFPAGLRGRLKMKAEELAKDNSDGDAFPFVSKECWVFYQDDYSVVRGLGGGSEVLGDIVTAPDDAANAKKIAARFGVPEQNIKLYTNQTQKDINKVFKDATRRLTKINNKEDKRSFVVCYVSGHGVAGQMQEYVLN